MGTATPQAAASGATRKLVLSPTPPVECLSTATLAQPRRRNFSPESRIAMVSARVSSSESPFSHAAISHAASCSSGNRFIRRARRHKRNLPRIQLSAVALLADDVDHVQRRFVRSLRRTFVPALPWFFVNSPTPLTLRIRLFNSISNATGIIS